MTLRSLLNYPCDSSNAMREAELRKAAAYHEHPTVGDAALQVLRRVQTTQPRPTGSCPSGGDRLGTAQTKRVKTNRKTGNWEKERQRWEVKEQASERGREGASER